MLLLYVKTPSNFTIKPSCISPPLSPEPCFRTQLLLFSSTSAYNAGRQPPTTTATLSLLSTVSAKHKPQEASIPPPRLLCSTSFAVVLPCGFVGARSRRSAPPASRNWRPNDRRHSSRPRLPSFGHHSPHAPSARAPPQQPDDATVCRRHCRLPCRHSAAGRRRPTGSHKSSLPLPLILEDWLSER